LNHDLGRIFFRKALPLLNLIEKLAALAQLCDYIEPSIVLEDLIEFEDVRVVNLLQQSHLRSKPRPFFLVIETSLKNGLDSSLSRTAFVNAFENLAKPT